MRYRLTADWFREQYAGEFDADGLIDEATLEKRCRRGRLRRLKYAGVVVPVPDDPPEAAPAPAPEVERPKTPAAPPAGMAVNAETPIRPTKRVTALARGGKKHPRNGGKRR